jgi:NAD(P)-dependent dehydrogenase (short-subunit alcohol dehydrogenase family)
MGADAARRLAADGFNVAILSSSGKGETLAEELGGVGFTSSNLVASNLQLFVNKAMEASVRIDVLVKSAGNIPKGDILEISDEVSSLIAYLASDEAAYITGQNFRIDGGLTRLV